jgi:hypothetical protein
MNDCSTLKANMMQNGLYEAAPTFGHRVFLRDTAGGSASATLLLLKQ